MKSTQTCLSNEYGDLTVQQGKQKKNQDNILIIEILKNWWTQISCIPAFPSYRTDPAIAEPHQKRSSDQSCENNTGNSASEIAGSLE